MSLTRINTPLAPISHLDYLDGWRGLAIGFLLIGHFYPVPGVNLGTVGVNLFFVLSGWLMTRLLFIKDTPIPAFYRRRISRIFPVHFFFLCLTTLLFVLWHHPVSWRELLVAALFVNNYFPSDPAIMPFGHIWSLAVEEHSYILLSVMALAARKGWLKPSRAIAFAAAVFSLFGVGYWLQFSGKELEFGKWLHTEVSAFGIFFSAYLMLHFHRRGIPQLPTLAYPALLLLGVAFHWWSIASPVRTLIGVGLFALTLNLLMNAPQLIQRALSFRPLRLLGVWSFSIYIWQQPFYLMLHRDGMQRELALGLALSAGLLSYYFIENPIRNYLNTAWGRART